MNPSNKRAILSAAVAGIFGLSGAVGVEIFHNTQWARAEDHPAQIRPVANSKADSPEATHEQISKAEDLSTVFRTVGKQMTPSVVSIEVRRSLKGVRGQVPDELFRRFFPDQREMPDPSAPDEEEQQQPREQIGTGSGVVMENEGGIAYIVTNHHVAGGAERLTVTLSDGRHLPGTLVGSDPKSDVAVVKIKGEKLPPAAHWGNSEDLQQGDWVMAFGSPFGYVGSMTHGIVSALDRTNVNILGSNAYEDFIQVDAPINPGNSGGPLVSLHGDVVGINTAIATHNGAFEGIGFAIPANYVQNVYKQLKDHGTVVPGWLGVRIADVSKVQDVAKTLGYSYETGVLVEETFKNTPAFGKLQHGDIITALNGKQVDTVTHLRNAIAETAPNTEVSLKVFRGGKTEEVKIKLGEQPADLSSAAGRPEIRSNPSNVEPNHATAESVGLILQTLTPELAKRLNITDTNSGVAIVTVAPRSIASRKGLHAGDVITEVNGAKVTTAEQAVELLRKGDLKNGVNLYVVSADGSRFIVLTDEKSE